MSGRDRLLVELAGRHLLGGHFRHFLRARWRRWLTALLGVAATAAAGLTLAMRGSPAWGALAFLGVAVLAAALHRVVHGRLPDAARGAYASAVTFVAVAGIGLAVMTFIVVVSVMDGFSRDIQRALLKVTPEVSVTAFDERLDPSVADAVKRVPGVVRVSPYIENDLLLKLDGIERPLPVKLRAAPLDALGRSGGPDLLAGSWSALDSPGMVAIGSELARLYGLRPGDRAWLVTSGGTLTPMGLMPGLVEVTVAGIFKSGFYEVDQGMLFAGLQTARDLFGMGEAVTGLEVAGVDPFQAPDLAWRIQAEMLTPVVVMSWADTRRNLYTAMQTEKVAMFVIESLLVLIASFNITSTLYMAIGRKTREIGLLLALGMSRARIVILFAAEGLAIGLTGTAVGALLGTGFCVYLEKFPVQMPGGGSVYYISNVPVHLSPGLVAATVAVAVTVSLGAALYPAWQASRLAPARALRVEG